MQLYRFVVPDDETALLAYSDSQWPKNSLWVEGGDATSCSMVSNTNGGNFAKASVACNTASSFYCEYKSETFIFELTALFKQNKSSIFSANSKSRGHLGTC
jgi:hypothetical protein